MLVGEFIDEGDGLARRFHLRSELLGHLREFIPGENGLLEGIADERGLKVSPLPKLRDLLPEHDSRRDICDWDASSFGDKRNGA